MLHGKNLRGQPLLCALVIAVTMIVAAAGCGGGRAGGGGATNPTSGAGGSGSAVGVAHPPVQSIPAGSNPHDVVAAGGMVWVADFGGPVLEFDPAGHQVRTIALDAQAIAPEPNGVWISELSNSNSGPQGSLAEIAAGTGQVSRRLTTEDSSDILAVGGGAVWAASRFGSRITRIDLSGGAQQTFPLPGTPTAIAVGARGVWVAIGQAGFQQSLGAPETGTGGVVELDPANGQVMVTQREGGVPTALLVAGGTIWVALADDMDELDRIDEASGRLLSGAPITVGRQPTDLAFGDSSVWVLNYSDATITRVDPATGRPLGTIAFATPTDPDRLAANSPIRLAVTPGALWVTDSQANTLHRLLQS